MSTPEVDIVIPTRGRGALVGVTIDSICQSRYGDFKLWIVDQSEDGATEAAVTPHCRADSRVRYVRSRSCGSNQARVEGVAAGHAPYILFTDDDCRVDPGWVAAMTTELSDQEHSAVFGRVIPDQEFEAEQTDGARAVSPAIRLAVKDHPRRQEFAGNRFRLDFGHGANMGLRRDAYQAIGGFDRLLGCGGPLRAWPERDLGYRILSRGGRIIYTPEAVVHHRHWRDWKEVRQTVRNYGFGTGAVAGKYLRSGDWGGAYLMGEWIVDQGARQILSGVLKWRSWQKIEAGLMQLVYPWVGLCHSLRYPVNRDRLLYEDRAGVASAPAGDAVAHFSDTARSFAALYQQSPEFLQRQELWHRLIDQHLDPAGLTIDVGCGSGVFTFHAARKGGRVIGVDGASDMIELCQERKRAEKLDHLQFAQGRLPDLDDSLLGEARLIICSSVLEYVEDLDRALATLARLLEPGGHLLVSMPNLLCLNRMYERASHRLTKRSPIYRYIRHFTLPGLLARRVARYGLDLREVTYYDHHTRLARLTRKLGLPEALTEDLFVAVLRKA
jgi:2-polyprenyl-3-methyl-5-hydroxy-6-metoxy-1,4-benzoquinol methylase/GT2 family glycosyltransferase